MYILILILILILEVYIHIYTGMYKYTLIYILIYSYIWSNEQHRCAYCGKRAYKYCVTCCDAGAWAVDT